MWFSLFFEPLVFIGLSLLIVVLLNKIDINIKYSLKIMYVILVFYIFVATPLGANYLISRVEVTAVEKICENKNIKTIVILGGGVTGDPTSPNEIWRLKEASYRRTLSGLEFAKQIENSTIILSGGYGGQYKEVDLMETLIRSVGFNGKIIKEGDSLSTYTSAVNVTNILLNEGIKIYWLVTSSLHMYRAESTFSKQGIEPCRYPVNSKYIDTKFPGAILPQISALDKSTAAFHEIVGYLWYTVSGKI